MSAFAPSSRLTLLDGMEWQSIRMASPKVCAVRAHELPQRPVIGLVEPLDPAQGLLDAEAAAIDFLSVATIRGIVPSPPATRMERVLAKGGSRPSNIRGSSS